MPQFFLMLSVSGTGKSSLRCTGHLLGHELVSSFTSKGIPSSCSGRRGLLCIFLLIFWEESPHKAQPSKSFDRPRAGPVSYILSSVAGGHGQGRVQPQRLTLAMLFSCGLWRTCIEIEFLSLTGLTLDKSDTSGKGLSCIFGLQGTLLVAQKTFEVCAFPGWV